MNKIAVINLKTDANLKKEAQELANSLGVSLSQVLNESLKRFTATREFTVVEDFTPTEELKAIIQRSKKPSSKKTFGSSDEAINFLDTL